MKFYHFTNLFFLRRRRCWADREAQERRKRNSRPNTRLTPFYNAYFVVPPKEYGSDTEGIHTEENRIFLTSRVVRQKFLDDSMTQAFIRKCKIFEF